MKCGKESLSNKKYKYIHIFLATSSFCLKLIELISDPDNKFNVEEQLFVTDFKPLYDAVKEKCHIEYCMTAGYRGGDRYD